MVDNSNVFTANAKLESYRAVGKEKTLDENIRSTKHMNRRIKENIKGSIGFWSLKAYKMKLNSLVYFVINFEH